MTYVKKTRSAMQALAHKTPATSDDNAVILIDQMSDFEALGVWLQEIAADMNDYPKDLRDPEYVRILARDILQAVDRLRLLEASTWQITKRWLEIELALGDN